MSRGTSDLLRPPAGLPTRDPSAVEGDQLLEAYEAIDTQLAGEMALLDRWVDEVAAEPSAHRGAREAAVAGAVTDLIELSREPTAQWLAGAARTAQTRAGAAAEASRTEVIDQLAGAWDAWQAVAQTALTTLAAAQRAVVIRALVRLELLCAEGVAEHLGPHTGPVAESATARSVRRRVRDHVERSLELMSHPHQMEDVARGTKAVCEVPSPRLLQELALRDGETGAEEWMELLASLRECEHTVAAQARSLQDSRDRLDGARQAVVAARHRAHAEDCRRQRGRQQAARNRQEAEQAADVARQVEAITERDSRLHRDLAVSSRQLREHGWKGLYKRLCNGNDHFEGLPRQEARSVLGLLTLVARLLRREGHAGGAADEFRARLAEEDALMADQSALAASMRTLSVSDDTRQAWGAIQPRLRTALAWVCAHWGRLKPDLALDAPEETRALGRVCEHLPEADRSTA